MAFAQLPPLSLYIHIPWCIKKCPYCDFNSHANAGALPEAEYVAALLRDLPQEVEKAQGRPLQSIFFGGGTPSLFSAASFHRILDAVRSTLACDPALEITLEANPGTAEHCDFAQLRATGINRLSLGVQSFNDRFLTALGRIHNGQEARKAFEKARAGGFGAINMDLMHGLPDQTPEQALDDIQTALSLQPEHLSWYQLTLEPNTVFYSRPPELPAEDCLADIQDAGEAALAAAGFEQYEVSAYARAQQQQAKHNLNYWQFGDYLALGAGAHGKISWPDGRIGRYSHTRLPQDYMQAAGSNKVQWQWVQDAQLPLEFMLNALRLRQGVTTALWSAHTGQPLQKIITTVEQLQERGLLEARSDRIVTTALGFRFLNEVVQSFAPQDAA
jgi:putative oxygen-independent coproporphyrinogen III oxidase